MAPIQPLPLRLAFFVGFGFSGGFTLSTSAMTSLNGSGMCGIGFELVIFSVAIGILSDDAPEASIENKTSLWIFQNVSPMLVFKNALFLEAE